MATLHLIPVLRSCWGLLIASSLLRVVFQISVVTACVLLVSSPLRAQEPTLAWTKFFNGTAGSYDSATDIATDASGNVYVTGSSKNASGNTDIVTLKYSLAGELLWTAIYDGASHGQDLPAAIKVDAHGNVYVTGESVGGALNRQDIAIIKYNSAGVLLWVRREDRLYADIPYAMAIDGAGNVIVTGGSQVMSGKSIHMDYYTVKYNSAGKRLWHSVYNGANRDDYAKAVAVDATGNVYISGTSYQPTGIEREPFERDFVTIKYSASGTQVWTQRYDYLTVADESSPDLVGDMAVDSDGNVIVVGASFFGTRITTLKYTNAGILQWNQNREAAGIGTSFNHGAKVVVDPYNNIYVFCGSWQQDQYYVIKYSASGSTLWEQTHQDGTTLLGSPDRVMYGSTMTLDEAGNLYVAGNLGRLRRSFIEPHGPFVISDAYDDDYEYFVIKYDAYGIRQWIKIYTPDDATNGYVATALSLDTWGNVYLAGRREDVETKQRADYLLVKYRVLPALATTLRLNCAGPAITTSMGSFSADNYFSPTSTRGVVSWSGDIAGTSDDGLYLPYREASFEGGSFSYRIPVYNGMYQIRLHFAELLHREAGRRVFNVNLEGGETELNRWDVFARVGAGRATVMPLTLSVSDGELTIVFESLVGRAMVSAIEILPASSARVAAKIYIPEEEPTSLALKASPNPFADRLLLHLSHYEGSIHEGGIQVEVVDLLGKVHHQGRYALVNEAVEMDLSFLATGLYLIRINTSNGIKGNLRIIKR